jgi:hypothetical protein
MAEGRFSELDDKILNLADETLHLGRTHSADSRSLDALTSMYDRWLTPVAQLAVVGPISSGKTMLLNALLRRRILPTDSRTWTSTWVQVYHAPVFSALAIVRTASGMEEHQIREDELETYLTVGGEPNVRRYHGRRATVVSVSIGIPFTDLGENLRLLDTPGTGGLRDAHVHTARAAIARADAVIFVSKPDTPISVSERRFLAEAVKRVTTCILVFTHRDILSPDQADRAVTADTAILCDQQQWKDIVGSAKEARELADRFRSVTAVSVSSLNWLDALRLPAGDAQTRLRDVSNFDALEGAINREIIQRIEVVHRRNILILCSLLNGNVIERTDHTRRLLLGDAQAEATQRKREDDIAKWTSNSGDAWSRAFEKRRNALHEDLAELAKKKVRELDSAYRHELPHMSSQNRDSAVQMLSEQPNALIEEMTGLGSREISRALEDVRNLLDQDDLAAPIEELIASRAVGSRLSEPVRPGPANIRFDVGDVRNVIAGGMAGGAAAGVAIGMGAVVASPVLFFLAPIALGAILFGGLGWMQKIKNRAAAEAVDYLDQIERLLQSEVVRLATEAADSAADAMKEQITMALASLADEITANKKAMEDARTASAEERERKIAECQKVIDQASALQAEGLNIDRDLSTAA